MRPLGNEKHISLSRKWTKAMRKADKAKGRQAAKKKLEKFKWMKYTLQHKDLQED
tara:strand:- start:557 stop:721 length:165 start_codon:yes stop_codon:yes gene_type:complete